MTERKNGNKPSRKVRDVPTNRNKPTNTKKRGRKVVIPIKPKKRIPEEFRSIHKSMRGKKNYLRVGY